MQYIGLFQRWQTQVDRSILHCTVLTETSSGSIKLYFNPQKFTTSYFPNNSHNIPLCTYDNNWHQLCYSLTSILSYLSRLSAELADICHTHSVWTNRHILYNDICLMQQPVDFVSWYCQGGCEGGGVLSKILKFQIYLNFIIFQMWPFFKISLNYNYLSLGSGEEVAWLSCYMIFLNVFYFIR